MESDIEDMRTAQIPHKTRGGWNRSMLSKEDPRKFLELHHIKRHKDGGENTADNLITLCNVCHDNKHKRT